VKVYPWVVVVVFRYDSPTEPIVVNVFGYESQREATARQRRIKALAKRQGVTDRLVACRVRPVYVEGVDDALE
jgi:hypothetical protein